MIDFRKIERIKMEIEETEKAGQIPVGPDEEINTDPFGLLTKGSRRLFDHAEYLLKVVEEMNLRLIRASVCLDLHVPVDNTVLKGSSEVISEESISK